MVKINRLTFFTFQINTLIDQGYNLSLNEAVDMCEKGLLFSELEKKYPFPQTPLDLSIINGDERKEIQAQFKDLSIAYAPKEFGVSKEGLCLFIAYAQEMIQRTSKVRN